MNQGLYKARMIPLILGAIWLTGYGAESKADNQSAQKSVKPPGPGSPGVYSVDTSPETGDDSLIVSRYVPTCQRHVGDMSLACGSCRLQDGCSRGSPR
jgi:hypothetical protein